MLWIEDVFRFNVATSCAYVWIIGTWSRLRLRFALLQRHEFPSDLSKLDHLQDSVDTSMGPYSVITQIAKASLNQGRHKGISGRVVIPACTHRGWGVIADHSWWERSLRQIHVSWGPFPSEASCFPFMKARTKWQRFGVVWELGRLMLSLVLVACL